MHITEKNICYPYKSIDAHNYVAWACDALMETPFLDDENDKHDRKLVIYDTCPSGSVIIRQ
jgi:hypothetical protein